MPTKLDNNNYPRKGPAGLLLFDSTSIDPMERYIFVLYSKRGYGMNTTITRCKSDNNIISNPPIRMIDSDGNTVKHLINVTVETISIPRGGVHHRDGESVVTAIREFVEETNLSPKVLLVYDKSFILWWRDKGHLYQYKIFIGLLGTHTISIFTDRKRYEYVRRDGDGESVEINAPAEAPNNNTIVLQRRRENRFEEKRRLIRLTLRDYLYFMIHYQIHAYTESNYMAFFQFVQRIDFFSKKHWTKYRLCLDTMMVCAEITDKQPTHSDRSHKTAREKPLNVVHKNRKSRSAKWNI